MYNKNKFSLTNYFVWAFFFDVVVLDLISVYHFRLSRFYSDIIVASLSISFAFYTLKCLSFIIYLTFF